MKLKIEGGILLKPYLAPYSRKAGKHRIPGGWTPDRTPEMHARFTELKLEAAGDVPDYLLWKKVEHERGEQMAKLRRPYPGWFPTKLSEKQFARPYRELYARMNPEPRVNLAGIWSGQQAVVPPDGDYILESEIMERVE